MKIHLVVFASLLFATSAFAESRKSFIYDIGKTSGDPRFTQTTVIETKPTGEKVWSSRITDPAGTTIMTERAEMKDGQLISQYVEQLQTNEAYEIKVIGKTATFLTYKLNDGKQGDVISTKKTQIESNFITGPMTEAYLNKNWSDLSRGKTLKVNFGVFEIASTVGFQFKKTSMVDSKVGIEMKPSNFLVSMLVDNIQIDFDKEEKRMVRFVGRTPLRNFINGKWQPMDAEILYLKPEVKP